MAAKGWLPVRRALLTALKANESLTDLVPEERIYPQAPLDVPGWPFVKCGTPSGTPIFADCVDGDEISISFHSFAKPREEGGEVVETAEDYADRIGNAVTHALHGQKLSLEGGGTATVRRAAYELVQDSDETDIFRHYVEFRVRVIA